MKLRLLFFAVAICGLVGFAGHADAALVQIGGGQTSVALDTELLAAAASLELSGVSSDVIAPGTLPDSVAFGINPRDAELPSLATTFEFDDTDFINMFSGAIEHTGSVFFNADTVEVGNFTIAFDAARAGTLDGGASGFYVESTVGIQAILFDVENPSLLEPSSEGVVVEANLLISPEFGQFLADNQLSETNLAGADVGNALVQAAVPEPSALMGVLIAAGCLITMARRRTTI
jgi:hypothetical protein